MKIEPTLENADQTKNKHNSICNIVLEKTRESAQAADEILHHHTYKLLASGMLLGLAIGYLVTQKCRGCSR
jgi:ElaB/YqjD/DUF883 family membrane-anchored ribosome-binding protein